MAFVLRYFLPRVLVRHGTSLDKQSVGPELDFWRLAESRLEDFKTSGKEGHTLRTKYMTVAENANPFTGLAPKNAWWHLVNASNQFEWEEFVNSSGVRWRLPPAGGSPMLCHARRFFAYEIESLDDHGETMDATWDLAGPTISGGSDLRTAVFDVFAVSSAGGLAEVLVSVSDSAGTERVRDVFVQSSKTVFGRVRTLGAETGATEKIAVDISGLVAPLKAKVCAEYRCEPCVPNLKSAPYHILICIGGCRIETLKPRPRASEWSLTVNAREALLSASQDNPASELDVVEIACDDGVSSARVRAQFDSKRKMFVARVPESLGGAHWDSARAKVQVRAIVNGTAGSGSVTRVERPVAFARFPISEIVDPDISTLGGGVTELPSSRKTWLYGQFTGSGWEELVGGQHSHKPFCTIDPFQVIKDVDTDATPEAVVIIDERSDQSTQYSSYDQLAALRWRLANGHGLELPAASEIEPGNSIAMALNIYGRSNSTGSEAFLALVDSADPSKVYSFPILRGGEDRTLRNPHAVAFDISHLVGKKRRFYDVEIRVKKAYPTADSSILFCFSGLRAVETTPFCPKKSVTVLGEFSTAPTHARGAVARKNVEHLCAVLKRPSGHPARVSGAEKINVRLIAADGLSAGEFPMELDAASALTRKEAIFSVPVSCLHAFLRQRIENETFFIEVVASHGPAAETPIQSERPMSISAHPKASGRNRLLRRLESATGGRRATEDSPVTIHLNVRILIGVLVGALIFVLTASYLMWKWRSIRLARAATALAASE